MTSKRQPDEQLDSRPKEETNARAEGDADEQVEENPDAERGERIHTGKTIARGGKSQGDVPGAQKHS